LTGEPLTIPGQFLIGLGRKALRKNTKNVEIRGKNARAPAGKSPGYDKIDMGVESWV
jgi:hypothetical protein